MTLFPDWTFHTPHDLEAEQTAVALGGHCDCLLLVDQTARAARAAAVWLELHLRRQVPSVLFTHRTWRVVPVAGCDCEPSGTPRLFRQVDHAVTHATSPQHIAHLHRVEPHQVATIAAALTADWADEVATERINPTLAARMHDPEAGSKLWDAGIHPDVALDYIGCLPNARGRVPFVFPVGMAYLPGHRGRARELNAQLDPDTAAWLLWSLGSDDPSNALELAAWLTIAPPALARLLLDSDWRIDDVDTLAHTLGTPASIVADHVCLWLSAGYRPTADDLAHLGHLDTPPRTADVDALVRAAEFAHHDVSRTQAALALSSGAGYEAALRNLIP